MSLITGLLASLSLCSQRSLVRALDVEQTVVQEAIESFHAAIAPRFARGVEDRLNPQVYRHAYNAAKGPRIAIGATELRCIVHLQVSG
jgi:hypothetical protein